MKAIFVHSDSVLRDSHIDPASAPDAWRLMPATLEAMRLLASEDTLVFLYSGRRSAAQSPSGNGDDSKLEVLVKQVGAAGGRVDALIRCPHDNQGTEQGGIPCKCWGEFPGAFWSAAARFALSLNTCYVLGDAESDVIAAYAAGARPLIVLCRRTVGEVLGNRPSHKDFPIATDLTGAVNYIVMEEEIARQLGRPRNQTKPSPPDEVLFADPRSLPMIKVTSPLAQSLQVRLVKSRIQLQDMTRWLTFLVLGAVGLSLGIAYMLTHFYRMQPFPAVAYYVTLQFISRPLRGALFIIWGIGIILLAARSFLRSTPLNRWRKPRT